MMTINESGMTFGPYSEDDCFHIEKSAVYAGVQDKVKIAEFLWVQERRGGKRIFIVEAKSSSPRPETQPNFDGFIEEIRYKMINTLLLFLGIRLGRHGNAHEQLPQNLRNLDLGGTEFTFVLAIRGHPEAWLIPLQETLNSQLYSIARTFAFKSPFVAVVNEERARQYGLIAADIGDIQPE
jgi:hypothetical protein